MPKPDKRDIKPIFVRLSEAERRRIRTLAVSQGLTMREAIMQAFEVWASQLRSGGLTAASKRRSLSGPEISRAPAGTPSKGRRQPAYASTGQPGGRPVETLPSAGAPSPAGGGSLPGLEALAKDWLRKADHFDWSKCPAAECLQTKKGNVWVAQRNSGAAGSHLRGRRRRQSAAGDRRGLRSHRATAHDPAAICR